MRVKDLIAGTYYRGRRARGRRVRLIQDIRGGRCTWSSQAVYIGKDGRRLVAGRTCKLETFARWAARPEQLALFEEE